MKPMELNFSNIYSQDSNNLSMINTTFNIANAHNYMYIMHTA